MISCNFLEYFKNLTMIDEVIVKNMFILVNENNF